ncbi:MAG TPA: DUF5682 family protein [Candidatus Limnocylindrales bacterium]|nr:DUF5682 family protein [Candidatus Limnocylindrales bacterium]
MSTILGIRHHGPGSARSVLAELERLQPDALLVEGPSDASGLIDLIADPGMRPPVALLVYAPDEPRVATFYPMAAFSPEWVALRWALEHGIPAKFIDLAAGAQFAVAKAEFDRRMAEATAAGESTAAEPDSEASEADEAAEGTDLETEVVRHDPLSELAKAAGEEDGERFWDRLVESRRDPGDLFAAVSEAMTAVRGVLPEDDSLTLQREAAMRRGIRDATKQGFTNVAVVCGAWHAPALEKLPTAAQDDRTLRALPKAMKTAAAWVPWTFDRLAAESGYGAGIESPGWYAHLWSGAEPLAVSWMARVGALFREEGLDASAAHLVEAVRLAETLAAMRGRAVPSLSEFNEAVRACLAMGSDLPLKLVRDRLIVGQVMGETPPDAPVAPLAADLEQLTRRLRMRPEPGQKTIDLDLRSETDRARSHLLHRLGILGVHWGQTQQVRGKSGTFHEVWALAWQPEFVIDLVAASRLGNTVEEAASNSSIEAANAAQELPTLTSLIEAVLLAELPKAIELVVDRIGDVAAVGADVPALMDALPPLARVLRYGNVRGTDATAVSTVVDGLVARVCIGLSSAAASLDDDAAAVFARQVDGVHGAIALLDDADDRAAWRESLLRLIDLDGLHGLVAGRATRLLLDEGVIHSADAARRMRLALSPGADPAVGAGWVEGFLRDSGTILLHNQDLFDTIDGWVTDMPQGAFDNVLPLLRRTIATFSVPERRSIGERILAGRRHRAAGVSAGIDEERANLVMPILATILGVEEQE